MQGGSYVRDGASQRETSIFQSWRTHGHLHDVGITELEVALSNALQDNRALRISPTQITLEFVAFEFPGIPKLFPPLTLHLQSLDLFAFL